MSNKKIFIIAILCLILFFILPLSFAEDTDNQTIIAENENAGESSSVDIYFDSSKTYDNGNGSSDSPYKYIRVSRIKDDCTIHLASGEYELDYRNYVFEFNKVNIIGSGSDKTIFDGDNALIRVHGSVFLSNLTLKNITILNEGNFSAANTTFCNSHARLMGHENSYGGAIFTTNTNENANVCIDSCTFENNYAAYGGAIYMDAGYLAITNSKFINNHAYTYGGAIACENVERVFISKSKFIKNYCDDGAGVIYIMASDFTADVLEIANSSATFGAAITTLNSDVLLNGINAHDNTAKYDGGAIYHMYGTFTLTDSNFTKNNARNGAALFIDNSSALSLTGNLFSNNNASNCAGAIYLLFNNLITDLNSNTYENNKAKYNNDTYLSSTLTLTIGKGDALFFKYNDTELPDDLPSNYSLKDYGYLTEVKNQQEGGNCWSFTAIAVLESCIKKISGTEFDFSEENMKNVMHLYSDYGWDSETNGGGLEQTAIGYLTSWLGPIYDGDDEYDGQSVLSSILTSVMHVQNILFLKREGPLDNEAIKKAIMKYGAVGAALYYEEGLFYNLSYYNPLYPYPTNHAVTIVGWDDNYSRDNFVFHNDFFLTPPGDGAWIVRNSWGPDWKDSGYFYVSYYDLTMAYSNHTTYNPMTGQWDDVENILYTIVLNETESFDKNYQYDIAGMTSHSLYYPNSNTTIWYKNIFNATDFEVLKAVSTYFNNKMTNWTVNVNVNGVLKTTKSGISDPGYWTINLDDFVELEPGDIFEVIFHVTSDNQIEVPTTDYDMLNRIPQNLTGISYISSNGKDWTEIFAQYNYVACIKAFTAIKDYNTTTYLDILFDGYNPVNITATVIDYYGNPAVGSVAFNLSGEIIVLNLTDGKASLIHNFDDGANDVSAVFEGRRYATSSNSTVITVSKKEVIFNLNVTRNLNNLTIKVTGDEKINESVTIYLNDENHTLTLVNGSGIYPIDNLANGNYTVRVILKNPLWKADEVSEKVEVNIKNTNIVASEFTTSDYSDEMYSVYLYDEDGIPLSGKTVIFKFNNGVFSNTTVDGGKASVPINLARGAYPVEIIFEGDNDYIASNSAGNLIVLTNVGAGISIAQSLYDADVTIEFSKQINENVRFTINGNDTDWRLTDGKVIIPLRNLANGNYNVSVIILNEYFNFTKATSNFTVAIIKTRIIAEDFTTTDFSGQNYTFTLVDENNNPLSGKQIRFILNGVDDFVKTDSNGKASIPINLNGGKYPISLSYSNLSDKYDNCEITKRINVKINISGEISVSRSLNNVDLTLHLTKAINGLVPVRINERDDYISVQNGNGLLKLNNLANGYYEVSVAFDREDYEYENISANFTVNVKHTRIDVTNTVIHYGCNESPVIQLLDEDGNLLNEEFEIYLNGNRYNGTNGNYTIPDLAIGQYGVQVKYLGSNDYFESHNDFILKVVSAVELPQNSYTSSAHYVVKLYGKNGAIANEDVKVTINGVEKVLTTDANGQISIDLGVGSYQISIVNPETGEVSSQTVNVAKPESKTPSQTTPAKKKTDTIKLILKNIKVKRNKAFKYTAKLLKNGKPLKGAKITFKIKGKTYRAKTTKKGIATIKVKKLKAGKYTVTAKYGKTTSKSKITVKK